MKFSIKMGSGIKEAWTNRAEPEHAHRIANFFWTAIVTAAAAVVLLAVFLGGWMLYTLMGEPAGETSAVVVAQPSPFKKKELEETVLYLRARAAAYEKIQSNPIRVTEPAASR